MGDVLFIVAFLGLLLIPFALTRMWHWVGTIASMGVCLGVGEALSKWQTGMTLSRTLWVFSLENPVQTYLILTCMLTAWILLLIHLAWWMITKRKK